MKKLVSPAPAGGVPYQNSDFYDILSDQQNLGYSAAFFNYISEATTGNTGLVIRGANPTQGAGKLTFDWTNWLVFLNGELMTPETDIGGNIIVPDGFTNQNVFIVESTPIQTTRTLRDGTEAVVIEQRVFTLQAGLPAGGQWIHFGLGGSVDDYNRIFTTITHTSRRLSTVLRNLTAIPREIRVTDDISQFANGRGYLEMYGWVMCFPEAGNYNQKNMRWRTIVGFDERVGADTNYLMGMQLGVPEVTLTDRQSGIRDHQHYNSYTNYTYPGGPWNNAAGTGNGRINYNLNSWTYQPGIGRVARVDGVDGRDFAQSALDPHTNMMPYTALAYIQYVGTGLWDEY